MSDFEPIFNADDLQENEVKKSKLIDLLHSGESILMVGAGCTASIYPDWQGFIDLLYEEAQKQKVDFQAFDPVTDDFLSFADRVKECIGTDIYYNVIFRCFKPKEKTHEKLHEVLCKLLTENKLRGITTTNYDLVFENALVAVMGKLVEPVCIDNNMEQAKVFEYLFSLNNGNVPKRVFHLHGIYDQKDSIILSKGEYERKYGFRLSTPPTTLFQAIQEGAMNEQEFAELMTDYGLVWTTHRKILWALFATRRLIFIGFSLNDPYFNKMLESVSKDLHTYGYDSHFLILRVRNKAEKERVQERAKQLKEDFGIETVFFEDDETNSGLEKFVFELEHHILPSKRGKILPKSIVVDGGKKLDETEESDEDLTQQLINISKQR